MRVLVVGGTGYIGYHIVGELIKSGHEVSVLCRNRIKSAAFMPEAAHLIEGDVNRLSIENYVGLLRPFDGLIYAAGVDERSKPIGESFEFYRKGNVEPCERLFKAVRSSNITHAVLLSSILSYMDRTFPEMELSKYHPYIRSRAEQNRICRELAGNDYVLSVLEVPWVFGASHEQIPVWVSLVTYVRGAYPLIVTRGGANVMSVRSVAKAAMGALLYPAESSTMPIGDVNMSWKTLIEHICNACGRRDKAVSLLPGKMFHYLSATGGLLEDLLGEQSGLDKAYMSDLVLKETYYDPAESQDRFQYKGGDLITAIQETVDATPENKHLKKWRKYFNV